MHDFHIDMPINIALKYVSIMLDRSGCCPLVITFGDSECHSSSIAERASISKVLLDHVWRWQAVENIHWSGLDDIANLHAPHLRRLVADPNMDHLPFSSCPALQHLEWGGLHFPDNPVIPWNQLTELKSTYITLPSAIMLLQSCPQLLTAQFVIDHPSARAHDWEDHCVIPLTTHRTLKSFSIISWFRGIDTFFDLFSFPALTHLSLSGNANSDAAIDLLERSGCALQMLMLACHQMDRNLVDFLQTESCSSLTSLILFPLRISSKVLELDEELIKAATIYPSPISTNTPHLFPKLETLVLAHSVCQIDGLFGCMIESRFKLSRCFKLFRYICHCHPAPSFHGQADMVIFEDLQQQGYNIMINHGSVDS
ncbi:hypothetical protein AMATHDRAFT_7708 [Amanita thiersii Skay4041]|uniref:F-box domain-containing protein n=1 Tax=Amanita thiersii Skay4041 TaxID=703135 RepID=A0A2A9NFL5_9AGAR|nr:hypothetical protein AMATHDRAFT_7708 [Amanita thiersii Skay4041]